MISLLIIAVISGTALLAWNSWLEHKYSIPFSTTCSCGHAAAFHKVEGGCRHTHDGSTDCYGYCTCVRTFVEVETRLQAQIDSREKQRL